MAGRKVRIFPIFEDVPEVIDRLTDAQLGRVFRQTLNSYFGKETREDGDALVDFVALMLLKQAERYDRYREGQRAHGQKSARKAEQVSQEEETKVCEEAQEEAMVCMEEAKEAMVCTEEAGEEMCRVVQGSAGYCRQKEGSDPPSPSPSPGPSPKKNILCSTAVELLNSLSGSSFRATTKATQRLLAARTKEGFTLEDIETVIRHQCALWSRDEKMRMYLRPETLFGSKFESYLSDAKRQAMPETSGYILAPLEDPWEVAMRKT